MPEFIDLIKSYGPGMAPWVLLFIFVAVIFGRGGTTAVGNVRALLADSEELRQRMKKSLDDCEAQIRRRDEMITLMHSEVDRTNAALRLARREVNHLEEKVHDLERVVDRLTAQLEEARTRRRAGDTK
jgi:chromosome segregation ATPase